MRRIQLGSVLLCTLLAGCVTATPSLIEGDQGELRSRRIEAKGDNLHVDLPAERGIHAFQIQGTPQQIYSHVAEVYQELGIPVELLDTNKFLIGNANYRVRGQIGKIPMARIVDCGHTISGPRAGRDLITFDLRTQVKPAGPGTVNVETVLIAVARSVGGASSSVVNCTSLGGLERQIEEGVQSRTGR